MTSYCLKGQNTVNCGMILHKYRRLIGEVYVTKRKTGISSVKLIGED